MPALFTAQSSSSKRLIVSSTRSRLTPRWWCRSGRIAQSRHSSWYARRLSRWRASCVPRVAPMLEPPRILRRCLTYTHAGAGDDCNFAGK